MKNETHIESVRESLDVIRESVARGLAKRQRTIGFHCSNAAVNLFEMFLHKQNLIDIGTNIKHDWFASTKTAAKRLPDFNQKAGFLKILNEIESRRNLLCYGKPQPVENIEELISLFYQLKEKLEKFGVKV